MKISEEKFIKIYNILLLFVSIALPFGKISNLAIIIFATFNLFFLKKIDFHKKSIKLSLLMLIPLILELFFYWNNDSFVNGLKSIERYITLIVFAIFIIGNFKVIRISSLLKRYALIMTILIFFLEIRFVFLYNNYIVKYINGIDLWEMGYVFTQSFKVHAPAINLQLVFVSCINVYFLIIAIVKNEKTLKIFVYFVLFIMSVTHVLIVNTRVSLFCLILCSCYIIFYEIKNRVNFKKAIIGFVILVVFLASIVIIAFYKNNFMLEKYTKFTFSHLDKVGKLDEIDHPEIHAYNGLVNRLSIWKSSIELANKNWLIGLGASDANDKLIEYYKTTNQFFLAKYKFATHNQYINYYLKFGIGGFLAILIYLNGYLYLGIKLKNGLVIAFFYLFLISNLTDDYLNRFDGIGFSSFFYSIFIVIYLKSNSYKSPLID